MKNTSKKIIAAVLSAIILFCTGTMNVLTMAANSNKNTQTTDLNGVYYHNGHSYKIFDDDCSWTDAKEKCEKMGGHLAAITSKDEQSFVESVNNGDKWIGGYKNDKNAWVWVTGEKWSYTNWDEGEPNNSSNVIGNERYVSVWPEKWNDLNNESSEQNGFICEWEYILGMGDINADSTVNSSDALMALQHSVGLKTLTGNQFTRGDAVKDGVINSSDALRILQYSVGQITKF